MGQLCLFCAPEDKPAPFPLELGNYKALNPSGLFSPQLVMRIARQDTRRKTVERKDLKKKKKGTFNIFLLSIPIPPFLCFNSFNNLAKAKPETRK